VNRDVTGRCLCGAVTFRARSAEDGVRACHCGQCRRWSGHVWAAVGARDLTVEGPLRWYRSSDKAERGFCTECGGALLWRETGGDEVDIAAGALDQPTGLTLQGHIWVADKGDYYPIADGLPQWPQGADT